jgi:hypothetical protein
VTVFHPMRARRPTHVLNSSRPPMACRPPLLILFIPFSNTAFIFLSIFSLPPTLRLFLYLLSLSLSLPHYIYISISLSNSSSPSLFNLMSIDWSAVQFNSIQSSHLLILLSKVSIYLIYLSCFIYSMIILILGSFFTSLGPTSLSLLRIQFLSFFSSSVFCLSLFLIILFFSPFLLHPFIFNVRPCAVSFLFIFVTFFYTTSFPPDFCFMFFSSYAYLHTFPLLSCSGCLILFLIFPVHNFSSFLPSASFFVILFVAHLLKSSTFTPLLFFCIFSSKIDVYFLSCG